MSLQVLRAVAALLVVYKHAVGLGYFSSHSFGWLGPPHLAPIGGIGVDIFFVISGAIIYRTAFEGDATPLTFLRKRLLRVAPLYWLVTAAFLIFSTAIGLKPPTWSALAATVTFWPAWDGMVYPAFSIGWTLCFEMLFYVCATLLLWAPRMLPVVLSAFLICWLLRWGSDWAPPKFIGNPLVMEFLFGVALMRWRSRLSRPSAFALLVAAMAAIALPSLPTALYDSDGIVWGRLSEIRALLLGVPAAIVVCAALALDRPHPTGVTRALAYLGDASYSLYLSHWALLVIARRWLDGSGVAPDLVIAAFMPAALILGIATHELVEKPILGVFRRRAPAVVLQPA